jgi:hypothetical protein
MIAYVKAHRISYCIVHKVDPLARNRADDVAIQIGWAGPIGFYSKTVGARLERIFWLFTERL